MQQKINYRQKGFFTFAQNNDKTDYVRLAYALALSIKHSQKSVPFLTIAITPDTKIDDKYLWAFDNIIEINDGDDAKYSNWKLENEYKVYNLSPYNETIKLDADMLFFSNIDEWWNIFESNSNDIIWTNNVVNWAGNIVKNDFYRKVFSLNKLPNIYSGFFYFRKSETTKEFFELSKIIFQNYQEFFESFLHVIDRPSYVSTDVVYALSAKILDLELTSNLSIPVFTHMKSHIQDWNILNESVNWTKTIKSFFDNNANCYLENHLQTMPLHYHQKEFITDDILKIYEAMVKK